MSNRVPDEPFDRLADRAESQELDARAPSRLKARLYSALVARMEEAGALRGLPETSAEGRQLCVFEQLVRIAPVGETVQSIFYCRVCHARALAERFENPPIFWAGCPYVQLKNR